MNYSYWINHHFIIMIGLYMHTSPLPTLNKQVADMSHHKRIPICLRNKKCFVLLQVHPGHWSVTMFHVFVLSIILEHCHVIVNRYNSQCYLSLHPLSFYSRSHPISAAYIFSVQITYKLHRVFCIIKCRSTFNSSFLLHIFSELEFIYPTFSTLFVICLLSKKIGLACLP